ncbi:MAG: exo-alpha-sialidase [Acidobacteriia bacterium]|nr:exo-alpha-sialidase [Terriglobia bacterium]
MQLKSILLLLPVALAASGQALKVEMLANPSGAESLQAHWGTASDESPLLSWLEKSKDGSLSLRYAVRRGAQWSEPRVIVANRQFFRQPAEAPSVISFRNGSLLAEWVEVPPGSGEAENLYVSSSKDGTQWTAPVMAHRDRSPVQHALASFTASGDNEGSVVWLEALKGEDAPSALKRTLVNGDGAVVKEETLDSDVCTCCPTSIVKTAKGLLVAYRDHTSKDIRDIAVVRLENGRWLPSRIVNPDNWEINACPVNGPAAAANNNRVAIAWYTEAQDSPRTLLAFSSDGGASFSKPIKISTGNSFGHTSVTLADNGDAMVSWLEEGSGDRVRLLARQVTNAGVAGPVVEVAQDAQRSIGYPRLLQVRNETWIAWGNSGSTKIHTARIVK